jgi:hypothetical protein
MSIKNQRGILIVVAVLIIVIGVGVGATIYTSKAPFRKAHAIFDKVLADTPSLSGTSLWNTKYEDSLAPAHTSFEPHGGYIAQRVTRVAATDEASTQKEFKQLEYYMVKTKGMTGRELVPGKKAFFGPLAKDEYTLSADVFIIDNEADLTSHSIILGTPGNEGLQERITEHFKNSSQPVYGYSINVQYAYF